MAVLPLPLALIACDHIWRDPNTEKMTILGTFSAIELAEFPGEFSEIAVFLALTDGHGRMVISVQLIDSAEALPHPIARTELEVAFMNPTATIETDVVLRDIVFPFPGEYRLQ